MIVRRHAALLLLALCLAAPSAAAGASEEPRGAGGPRVEVVVELEPPPAARAGFGRPGGQARARAALRAVEEAQRAVARRIRARLPAAGIRWRYRIVLAGLAVVLPARELETLARIPGVVRVYPSVRYRPLLDATPSQIGAPALWGPGLRNAGRGVKIGIIDDGIDPAHPFFDPAGMTMPGGFPRGDAAYTTAKVIVARAFPPPDADWPRASRPFDPLRSFHGTHVAGIAAGRHGTTAPGNGDRAELPGLSGVAPLAYLGNYRALTVPTETVGLNGNTPELVAAVEAAVADGMDVVNLSLGEPEIEPARDALAIALDNAAAAGVVPVVSAGNDYQLLGAGSVGSPGTAASAVTVAAVAGPRFFGTAGRVVGPPPVPPAVEAFGGLSAGPIPARFSSFDQRLVDARSLDPAGELCAAAAPGSLAGRLVLVREGGCRPELKTRRARAAGAVGLVLALRTPGDPRFVAPAGLPLLAVSAATGDRLAAFLEAAGGEALVRIDGKLAGVPSEEAGEIAAFSARGPAPLSLAFKPDLSAPGVEVLSAQPRGTFETLSGTSMAAPHVAGAAALLVERHPEWTVEQIKSALVQTADPAWSDAVARVEAPATRQGGGIVDLREAADPLLFASPQTLSLGLLDVRAGPRTATRTVALADAGGGAGVWSVAVDAQTPWAGAELEAPERVEVPGALTVRIAAGPAAAEGERRGFLVLERNGERRRIPFFARVTRPLLPGLRARLLPGPGLYRGSTVGREPRVSRYRYPETPSVVTPVLRGAEQAFRLVLPRDAVNLGVAVVALDPGARIQPRIVLGADENRLGGATALPYVANPYLPTFLSLSRASAVLWPRAGAYTIVFDSPRPRDAGAFAFRVWVDDTVPPSVRLRSRVARRGVLTARVGDRGAGVDPEAIFYRVDDGPWLDGRLARDGRTAVLEVFHVPPGRHRLELRVADRQEAKNNENVTRVLPNTRVVRAWIRVPPLLP